MVQCTYADCSWRSIAPSEAVAVERYAEHVLEEHAREVDADVPEGMVQIKLRPDGEWITTTYEEARRFHEVVHGD